jgi:hypothetical protein
MKITARECSTSIEECSVLDIVTGNDVILETNAI